MPMLNFQSRFAALVANGAKTQTIRKHRKDGRDPQPGDVLYLYTGARTKACRKLRVATCSQVTPIEISERRVKYWPGGDFEMQFQNIRVLMDFAKRDGFLDWAEMEAWFRRTHGLPFRGLLIQWEGVA